MSSLEILERSFRALDVSESPGSRRSLCGIYMLTNEPKIVYIGSSIDIPSRIKAHHIENRSVSRRVLKKHFTGVLWYPLPLAVHAFYEGAFIRFLNPEHNIGPPPAGGDYDDEIISGFGLDPNSRPDPSHLIFRKFPRSKPKSRELKPELLARLGAFESRATEELHRRVLAHVSESRLSRAELTELTGWHPRRVARILTGHTQLKLGDISVLAHALGKNVNDLYEEPSPGELH